MLVDETLASLAQLARLTAGAPPAHLMAGYLLAHPERTRFVSHLDPEAPLAMTFGVHRRIEVPMMPWQGFIRGVPIPDPLLWIDSTRGEARDRIDVRVSTDDPVMTRLMAPLQARSRPREERAALERHMESLRTEVDRALDIYAEVKRLMQDPDHEADGDLPRFLSMAEGQMEQLGRELARLKARIEEG